MPIQDLFVYQAPNDGTAPRYKAITDAWGKCHHILDRILENFVAVESPPAPTHENYAEINAACKAFSEVIQKVCPPSADRDAAERCVRLARMKANEAMRPSLPGCTAFWAQQVAFSAFTELLNAKLQANAAVALALPPELPPLETCP